MLNGNFVINILKWYDFSRENYLINTLKKYLFLYQCFAFFCFDFDFDFELTLGRLLLFLLFDFDPEPINLLPSSIVFIIVEVLLTDFLALCFLGDAYFLFF